MSTNTFLQPVLENENIKLEPFSVSDYDALFAVASDPAIWEQHPNHDRYQPEVFKKFFQTILATGGALKITDKASGQIIGSSSYYQYDPEKKSVFIGYTFFATQFWGTGINPQVKKLMLEHIFQYVENVLFHVGEHNVRSQIAVKRLGAMKEGEEMLKNGPVSIKNFVYSLSRSVLF